MTKVEQYRTILQSLDDWDAYLQQESGLPGPRGNLELAQAVADVGDEARFARWLTLTPGQAPTNTPQGFLVFCGVNGLGKLLAEGRFDLLPTLRRFASDPRWRVREAVAMALQRLGDVDMAHLLDEMEVWSAGTWLEQRAAAAAIAEPRLLHEATHARRALHILDSITAALTATDDRRSEPFRTLRQALGYCWSVVAVALPDEGKPLMEHWLASDDKDVRWIMQENLKKKRLAVMDEAWVNRWRNH